MKLKPFFVAVVDANDNLVTSTSCDTMEQAEDFAARSVNDKGQGGYMAAMIYQSVKACRAPKPTVEWSKAPAPRKALAHKADKE